MLTPADSRRSTLCRSSRSTAARAPSAASRTPGRSSSGASGSGAPGLLTGRAAPARTGMVTGTTVRGARSAARNQFPRGVRTAQVGAESVRDAVVDGGVVRPALPFQRAGQRAAGPRVRRRQGDQPGEHVLGRPELRGAEVGAGEQLEGGLVRGLRRRPRARGCVPPRRAWPSRGRSPPAGTPRAGRAGHARWNGSQAAVLPEAVVGRLPHPQGTRRRKHRHHPHSPPELPMNLRLSPPPAHGNGAPAPELDPGGRVPGRAPAGRRCRRPRAAGLRACSALPAGWTSSPPAANRSSGCPPTACCPRSPSSRRSC